MESQALSLLIEFGAPLITIGLWWQIWNFKKYLGDSASAAGSALKETRAIMKRVEQLERDHEEIKETLKNVDRNIDAFSGKVEEKIERILTEHSSHEKDQAVILEILRDLKNERR